MPAAPAWLGLVHPDLQQAVLQLRQTAAWAGLGTAAPECVPGEQAGTHHDLWQSPEVCLVLAMLAEEHAASLLGVVK